MWYNGECYQFRWSPNIRGIILRKMRQEMNAELWSRKLKGKD
jgi:hypothetical protein